MLKNKQLRLAGLVALLVVILAGGGGLFFFFSREKEGKTESPKTQEPDVASLELSYTVSSHERPVEYWLDGTLLFWEDQLMVVSKDQVLDYATHEPVVTLPRAIAAYDGLEEGENRPSALCLGENGSCSMPERKPGRFGGSAFLGKENREKKCLLPVWRACLPFPQGSRGKGSICR